MNPTRRKSGRKNEQLEMSRVGSGEKAQGNQSSTEKGQSCGKRIITYGGLM